MSETYPNKGTRETLFAGHTPSSVGIDCKITNYFSFLQIKNATYVKKHKWRLGEGTMRYAIVRNQKAKK